MFNRKRDNFKSKGNTFGPLTTFFLPFMMLIDLNIFDTFPDWSKRFVQEPSEFFYTSLISTFLFMMFLSDRPLLSVIILCVEWCIYFLLNLEIKRSEQTKGFYVFIRSVSSTVMFPLHVYFGGRGPFYLFIFMNSLIQVLRGDYEIYGVKLMSLEVVVTGVSMYWIGLYTGYETFSITFMNLNINLMWNWLVKFTLDREVLARREKQSYFTLIQAIEEGLVRVDLDLKIFIVNRSFGGINKQEILGKYLPDTPMYNEQCIFDVMNKNLTKTWNFQHLGRVFHAKATPIHSDQDFLGVCILITDITEKNQAYESELKAIEALTSLKAKIEFIASISHEIRNPLQAIVFSLENLECTHLEPSQIDLIRDIRNSANLLTSIIGDILDISKIEAGKMEVTLGHVNVVQCIETAIDINVGSCHHKGIALSCFLQLNIPKMIRGDSSRMIQVLSNMLNNAVKYTRGLGDVTIRASREGEMIKISVEDKGVGIKPEDVDRIFQPFTQIEHINESLNKNPGLGLGLPITKGFVEGMNGRIGVDSTYGSGSTFWITLPLEGCSQESLFDELSHLTPIYDELVVETQSKELMDYISTICHALRMKLRESLATALSPRTLVMLLPVQCSTVSPQIMEHKHVICFGPCNHPDAFQMRMPLKFTELIAHLTVQVVDRKSAPESFHTKSLLVVEDNPLVHKSLVRLLENIGVRGIRSCFDGTEALEVIQNDPMFDLVLMDILMPKMDGITALQEIRKLNPPKSDTKILLCTGNVLSPETIKILETLGVKKVLSKPIRKDDLIEVLKNNLKM